jgi:hypothetical protein
MKRFIKLLICSFLIFVAVLGLVTPVAYAQTTTPSDDSVDCSGIESELLPNPDDCNSFIQCSNGVAVLQKCPSGLYYSPEIQQCGYPENSSCISDETSFFNDTFKSSVVSSTNNGSWNKFCSL